MHIICTNINKPSQKIFERISTNTLNLNGHKWKMIQYPSVSIEEREIVGSLIEKSSFLAGAAKI
jgi:hypothetical protein